MLAVKTSLLILFLTHQALSASSPSVDQITEPVDHSECPSWDSRNGILYFVNIHAGEIYRYVYETKDIQHITLDGEVAPVVQSKRNPNLLIAGLDRSVVAVEWDGESPPSETRVLTTFSTKYPTSRVNDGKADKEGRFWIGTMGDGLRPNEGLLYEITCENLNSPLVEIAPVNISNGLAWNKANDKFYYIDTPTGQVLEYSYDNSKGEISNPRVAFDVTDHDSITGSPDGMTIDKDDNLWVALYGGSAVVKVNPATRDLLQVVSIPAEDVTSVMWGGPDLDVLFVTTSRIGLTEEQKEQQPAAGAVFAVTGLETQGLPVFEVDLLESVDDESCGTEK